MTCDGRYWTDTIRQGKTNSRDSVLHAYLCSFNRCTSKPLTASQTTTSFSSARASLDQSEEYARESTVPRACIVHLHVCCTGGLFAQTTPRSIEAFHWGSVFENTQADSCNASCMAPSVTVNGANGVGSSYAKVGLTEKNVKYNIKRYFKNFDAI